MNSRTVRALCAAILLSGGLTVGCADLERGPRPDASDGGAGDAGATDGDTPTFAAVRALLVQGCVTCHAAGGAAASSMLLLGGDAAADFKTVHALVDVTNPGGSRLLSKAGGTGHGGGTVWTTAAPERAAVLAWIQSGANP